MENNGENTNMSLREAIEAGFNRVDAEEADGEPAVETAEAGTTAEGGESDVANSAQGSAEETPAIPTTTPPATETPVETQTHNAERDNMLASAMQIIKSLRERNAQLEQMQQEQGAAMKQQTQMAENAIEQSITAPQIPQIDFSQLQYMNDDERNAAMTAWQNAIMEQAAAKVRAEFAPVKADYEEKTRAAAENAAKNAIFGDARFADFAGNSADIDRIAASPVFKGATPEQKYLYAGLIARGMKHNPSAKPSTDEILQMAMSNPDVLKAIETRRAQEVRDKNAELPVLSASSGMSGANPLPQNKVTTREELDARMKARFGLK